MEKERERETEDNMVHDDEELRVEGRREQKSVILSFSLDVLSLFARLMLHFQICCAFTPQVWLRFGETLNYSEKSHLQDGERETYKTEISKA